jgi:hypothetical protein
MESENKGNMLYVVFIHFIPHVNGFLWHDLPVLSERQMHFSDEVKCYYSELQ